MLETATLTAFFRTLVRGALDAQQVTAGEHTEHYLVGVLERFAHPENPNLLDPPLALDYLEAAHLPTARRFEKLKRVADTALFVTGVFVDSLDRTLVGPEYYTALGRNAYGQLSSEPTTKGLSALFSDLAERFPRFVAVLMEVAESDIFRREQDTLRLYKRWLATGGQREADLLLRRGLVPVNPPSGPRH